MASIVGDFGTDEQKERLLSSMASGDIRGALGLTESEAGSDVQNIQTTATRDGEEYVLNGSKMFITNGEHGNAVAVLAKTDPHAEPRYRGISCFVVQKPTHGSRSANTSISLGYRALTPSSWSSTTCESPSTLW